MKRPAALTLIPLLAVLALTLAASDWLWSLAGNTGMQALGGWLALPMRIFTFLGDEQFYLIAIPVVYWCIHKGLGADLGVLLVLSSFTNGLIKSFIKHNRPFWQDAALQLGDASSFSTPSGHAQTSTALFGHLAVYLSRKRRGALGAALLIVLIALVALSRVYLGVHFAGDILWGAMVGLLLLTLYGWLKPVLLLRLKPLSPGLHALLALILAAAMFGAQALLLSIPFGIGETFGELYVEARSTTLEEAATVAGLAFGLWVGLALEMRYVQFSVAGPLWQRAVRYLVGLAGLFAIWMGLRMVFPQEPLLPALALRVVRYALAMLWAIVAWPWLFVRIGLGTGGIQKEPQPTLQATPLGP